MGIPFIFVHTFSHKINKRTGFARKEIESLMVRVGDKVRVQSALGYWYGFISSKYRGGAYVLLVESKNDLMRLGTIKRARAEGYQNEQPFADQIIGQVRGNLSNYYGKEIPMVRKRAKRRTTKNPKWGRIGAPHSAKRRDWMKKIAKKRR